MYGCFSMTNIYVGNLSYQLTSEELREAFEQYGEVSSANVIIDKLTGRSKGFGFVEMPDPTSAEEAIKQLDGQPLKGRNVRVNEARPRSESQSAFPPRRDRRV
jgi:RNA recognition motif-containing protein